VSGPAASLRRVRLIAGQTFLEAVRQRFFAALFLVALGLVLSSGFFQSFDFGGGELKFLLDFGFGGVLFFGSVLAIVATAQLFFSEMENRTALTLLAKPVYRLEFLAGKFLGITLLLLAFVLVLTLTLAVLLLWHDGGEAAPGPRYGDLAVFALLQWLRLSLLAAITLFLASFSRTALYTMVVAFIVLLICQLQYVARDAYLAEDGGAAAILVRALGLVFPNFQLFNLGDRLVLPPAEPPEAALVLRITLYALAYLPVLLLLAQWNFRHREI
jgi:hypothetical protein